MDYVDQLDIVSKVIELAESNDDFKFLSQYDFKYPYIFGCDSGSIVDNFDGISGYVGRFIMYSNSIFYNVPNSGDSTSIKGQFNYIFAITYLAVCLDKLTNHVISNNKEIEGFVFMHSDPAYARRTDKFTLYLKDKVTDTEIGILVEPTIESNPTAIIKAFTVENVLRDCTAKISIKVFPVIDSSGTTHKSVVNKHVSVNKISTDLIPEIKRTLTIYKQANKI